MFNVILSYTASLRFSLSYVRPLPKHRHHRVRLDSELVAQFQFLDILGGSAYLEEADHWGAGPWSLPLVLLPLPEPVTPLSTHTIWDLDGDLLLWNWLSTVQCPPHPTYVCFSQYVGPVSENLFCGWMKGMRLCSHVLKMWPSEDSYWATHANFQASPALWLSGILGNIWSLGTMDPELSWNFMPPWKDPSAPGDTDASPTSPTFRELFMILYIPDVSGPRSRVVRNKICKAHFVLVCTCMRSHTCVHVGVRSQHLQLFSTVFFEVGFLAKPAAHWWSSLVDHGVRTVFAFQGSDYRCMLNARLLLHGCWESELRFSWFCNKGLTHRAICFASKGRFIYLFF